MHAAGHQASAARQYDVLGVTAGKPQDRAVGRKCLAENFQWFHEIKVALRSGLPAAKPSVRIFIFVLSGFLRHKFALLCTGMSILRAIPNPLLLTLAQGWEQDAGTG
jgi:hypothetical protein